jgi:hypothetical protein
MSNKDIEELAEIITAKLAARQTCNMTEEEQAAIRDLLQTKKSVVKGFLLIIGALTLWMLKDVYLFITKHIGVIG